jgi:hypothetical protein
MNIPNIPSMSGIPGLESKQESCIDSIKEIPTMLGLMKMDALSKGEVASEGIKKFLKFISSLFLFICIFPLIPILYFMAIMLAVIKYVFLKLRVL